MNYVSCSPFRVPIARLAAAQAELKFDSPLAKSSKKPRKHEVKKKKVSAKKKKK